MSLKTSDQMVQPSGLSLTSPVPNRAGMVCFNRAGHILLVSSLSNSDVWVLPKGHIEANEKESTWMAAEREVKEEAGLVASIDAGEPIGLSEFTFGDERVVVEWWTGYALRRVPGGPLDPGRLVKFVHWREALKILTFPDLRNAVRAALCEDEERGP